ncbi:SGNH hydrolase-type esterase domain-containing protein [Tanacetum coccineum]
MVSGTSSKKLMKGIPNKKMIPSSVSTVISDSDLLIEILVRLPVVSHLLLKSISKHWLSLIKSPYFIFRQQSRNSSLLIGSPYGILIKRYNVDMRRLEYDFESFDVRIPSKRSTVFTLGSEAPLGDVEILHACNGLLLCCIERELYVYNPTINQFKRLRGKLIAYSSNRMAFYPTKSPHYKVIQLDLYQDDEFSERSVQLRIYSSQTGDWSVCGDRFHSLSFAGFNEGVYWNNAIHWLTNASWMKFSHFKLDIENELPV